MTNHTPQPDVLVVGGGTAGCAAAAGLAADGAHVLLLEAGPDYGCRGDTRWPPDLLNAFTLPSSHDWGYTGEGRSGQALAFERCRVIGGCSSHFGTTLTVGWGGDYDRWAHDGSPGWDAAALTPEFDSALSSFQARAYDASEIHPFHRAVIDCAVRAGIPRAADFVSLSGGAGVGCPPVCISQDGTRLNAAFAYLDAQRGVGRLTVLGNVLVEQLLLRGDRVHGVNALVDGRRLRLSAHEVLLCAGTFGSPEILLRSGVGPPDDLEPEGVSVAHALDGVGRNLHDQPAAVLEYAASRKLADALAALAEHQTLVEEQSVVKLRSPYAGDAPYDLHVYPTVERDATLANGWRCTISVALLRPCSRGTVTLGSSRAAQRGVVRMGYLREPADLDPLAWGVRWALGLADDDELAELLDAPQHTVGRDERMIESWILTSHRHYWHPAGSCRMGPVGDPGAVVDPRGRVHGLSGVYVADASVFPDVPRATTGLPSAVVGQHIGRMLNTN